MHKQYFERDVGDLGNRNTLIHANCGSYGMSWVHFGACKAGIPWRFGRRLGAGKDARLYFWRVHGFREIRSDNPELETSHPTFHSAIIPANQFSNNHLAFNS